MIIFCLHFAHFSLRTARTSGGVGAQGPRTGRGLYMGFIFLSTTADRGNIIARPASCLLCLEYLFYAENGVLRCDFASKSEKNVLCTPTLRLYALAWCTPKNVLCTSALRLNALVHARECSVHVHSACERPGLHRRMSCARSTSP